MAEPVVYRDADRLIPEWVAGRRSRLTLRRTHAGSARAFPADKLKFVQLATLVAPVRRNPPSKLVGIRRVVI